DAEWHPPKAEATASRPTARRSEIPPRRRACVCDSRSDMRRGLDGAWTSLHQPSERQRRTTGSKGGTSAQPCWESASASSKCEALLLHEDCCERPHRPISLETSRGASGYAYDENEHSDV